MPEFTSMDQLAIYINQMAKKAMNEGNAVKELVIETGEKHVQTDVYDVYTPDPNNPRAYKRTGQLQKDWDTEETDNGMNVFDTRTDQERDVVSIVDTGQGYQHAFPYAGVPRPFIENTVKELNNSTELKNALGQDMKAIGLTIE